MTTKREPKQEHMPVLALGTPGQNHGMHVECDYCDADATQHHWATSSGVDRDCYACDEHVGLLNRYAAEWTATAMRAKGD